jgi:hypothetical protein
MHPWANRERNVSLTCSSRHQHFVLTLAAKYRQLRILFAANLKATEKKF